jgi:hypothetical protein
MFKNHRWAKLIAGATAVILCAASLTAQQPAAQPAPSQAKPPVADLNQIMRALFFPLSNVIFYTQIHDPAAVKPTETPSTSSDPLTGVFGKWEAVENSALTLADAAELLMTPGRKCSNGKDVPLSNLDWAALAAAVREGGKTVYEASKTKNLDKMTEAADVLNNTCVNCHNRYRGRVRCEAPAPQQSKN